MGLDIYVGTLSRYYSGNWETIIQQISREQGMEVQVVRSNESQSASTNQAEIHNLILSWRRKLSTNFQNKTFIQFDWDESAESPYFTDKPTWDSYWGLLLWAAYAEHPNLKPPAYLPNDLSEDPAYQAGSIDKFQHKYSQLLDGAEFWLPCDFDSTFRAIELNGNNITIGSTKTLLS